MSKEIEYLTFLAEHNTMWAYATAKYKVAMLETDVEEATKWMRRMIEIEAMLKDRYPEQYERLHSDDV